MEQAQEELISTLSLATSPLFRPRYGGAREEAFRLSYERAAAINKHYSLLFAERAHRITLTRILVLTVDDILDLTPKFWNMHMDGIILSDIGSHVLLSVQHNLVAGTIAPFAQGSGAIQNLLQKILSFQVSYVLLPPMSRDLSFSDHHVLRRALFMLTEIAHGLDAKNLETTVTLQSDGSFILHTPRPEASK